MNIYLKIIKKKKKINIFEKSKCKQLIITHIIYIFINNIFILKLIKIE